MTDPTGQVIVTQSPTVPVAVPTPGTPAQQAAADRLKTTLRAWGPLVPSTEQKRIVSDVLPKFVTWLSDASTKPSAILQLTQVMLADSAIPAIHKRPFLKAVWSMADERGIGFGGDQADLRYVQALLLAAWPREKILSTLLMPTFLESAFAIQPRAEEETRSLEEWRMDLSRQIDYQGPGPAQLMELLWWGQAGYCHRLERPYRKLQDPMEILFFASLEVAERAMPSIKLAPGKPAPMLPIPPTAAYLGRILGELGQDLDHQLSLYDWLTRLHQMLPAKSGSKLGAGLEALLQEDPLGLPVSWVRWLKGQGQTFPSLDAARKRIGLPLDEQIDLAQFAELVLRESMLDRFLERWI